MPLSPAFWHSGIGVIAALSSLALSASILTLIASALLLWRYRMTIGRLMKAHAATTAHPVRSPGQPDPHPSPSSPKTQRAGTTPVCSTPNRVEPEQLYRRTIVEPRLHAATYAVAGGLFALVVATASFFAFARFEVNYLHAAADPLQFVFSFWCFAWPIVLTVNRTAGGSPFGQWLNVSIYFAILLACGGLVAFNETEASVAAGNVNLPAWSGETPARLLFRWAFFNLAPTLLIAAFRHRRVRAVAPLMLGFMTLVSAGILGAITAALVHRERSIAIIAAAADTFGLTVPAALVGYLVLAATAAGLIFAVLGWGVLMWLRRGYQRKRASDQSLAIDALWLIFASFYAVMLATAGPGWALFALIAFVLYKVAFRLANLRMVAGRTNLGHAPALLVLRVFALGKRSEALFEALTGRWRHIGNVSLIAGEDLALSTAAPHRFLAFLIGRLASLFIGNEQDQDRAIAAIDRRRDADGRFRINEFLCHEDTWQAVFRRLIENTDVVLMDLRSFSPDNDGCVIEIRSLLATVPADQLVFVVDDSTDKAFLEHKWKETCRELRPDSPNAGLPSPLLRPFELDSLSYGELQRLLRRLCAAVSPPR